MKPHTTAMAEGTQGTHHREAFCRLDHPTVTRLSSRLFHRKHSLGRPHTVPGKQFYEKPQRSDTRGYTELAKTYHS
ncbi:hypothetical protein E2C01_076671 [Portunus trituberculatus]|uniref:Uncharacterized protein n=1 Tax=Portunus trituberculatus TaxID=210409 RepID=A0A5B7IMN1_PORTR|nr:hypothetical protein [Portunus trituberculatus]